ncbi:DUF916 and DUF3324 domain-containing protein [Enterococcus faecium]
MNRIWNKSHRNNCSLLLILLLGFILWQTPVHASEFNFAVDFELPANQIDKNKTYINVRMEPGKTQEIPYTVFNRTDKPVIVETLIHSATTNSNGVIEYGESKSKLDETLSYDMKNLAKTVGEITVPPQSAVTETLSLKAPEKELAGVVAGGITFQEKKENVSNKSTVGVVNQFSQVKAILIRNSEKESSPDLKLKKAYADQSDGRNVIKVNLQNPNASYMFGLTTSVEIYKKESKEPYLSIKKEKIDVAPNTNFDLLVPLEGKKLAPGHYQAVVKGAWKEKRWNLHTDFEITDDAADQLNEKDIDLKNQPETFDWRWLILVGVILIGLFAGLFILKERRKKK